MTNNTFKAVSLAFFTLTVLTLHSGCVMGVKGDGNVIEEERPTEQFTRITAGGAFNIFLTQGDQVSLVVEADENLLPLIKTHVSNSTLRISTTKSISDVTAMNIHITFTDLEEIDISGACSAKGEHHLVLGDIEIECSGASGITLSMDAGKVEVDNSGASSTRLSGTAGNLDLKLSGASKLKAEDFAVKVLNARISGASHGHVTVSEEMSAEVSGAGSLKYAGTPRIIHQDVSGAGSIKSVR